MDVSVPSLIVCWADESSCHSTAAGVLISEVAGRFTLIISHKMTMNKIRAVKDNIEPIDEITFHFTTRSG